MRRRLKIAETQPTLAGARSEREGRMLPELSEAALRPRSRNGVVPELVE